MNDLQRWLARNPHGETIKLVSLMLGFPLLIWCVGHLIAWLLGYSFIPDPDGGYW